MVSSQRGAVVRPAMSSMTSSAATLPICSNGWRTEVSGGSAVAATISFGAMKLVGNSHVEDCYKTALALLPADQRALANAKA